VRYHHLPDQATEDKESAYATWLGNQLSKRIDLEADLAGFDEFAAKHREFCQLMKDCNGMLASHDEVKFLSEAYECLRNAKGLIDVTAGSDDTGPGSR
jgi:biotin synthase-related radical SAM superfamily protein